MMIKLRWTRKAAISQLRGSSKSQWRVYTTEALPWTQDRWLEEEQPLRGSISSSYTDLRTLKHKRIGGYDTADFYPVSGTSATTHGSLSASSCMGHAEMLDHIALCRRRECVDL